ncbi:uncharacterized protein LOC135215770 [Macrobrachium nipponense]|uniref:uncharacterized protein LOC135215770 n=1 Tax=Macrobrachium nipponense TaxID=159736 RepID=UPI0030C8953E
MLTALKTRGVGPGDKGHAGLLGLFRAARDNLAPHRPKPRRPNPPPHCPTANPPHCPHTLAAQPASPPSQDPKPNLASQKTRRPGGPTQLPTVRAHQWQNPPPHCPRAQPATQPSPCPRGLFCLPTIPRPGGPTPLPTVPTSPAPGWPYMSPHCPHPPQPNPLPH